MCIYVCVCVCVYVCVCMCAYVRACVRLSVRVNLIHFIAWGEREREREECKKIGRKEPRKAGMKNSKKRQLDDRE